MADSLKKIGITLGDITGIGPEIVVKALSHAEVYRKCKPIVIGNIKALNRAIELLGAKVKINAISSVNDACSKHGIIDVINTSNIDINDVPYGQVSMQGGVSAYQAIEKVIELAMNQELDATVTSPINKEALHKAGFNFNGHTEIYGYLTGTNKFTMMLAYENLRVVHVSTHVALREACDLVKKDRIFDVILLAHNTMKKMGIRNPRIAVAGLNPHAGENGLFGQEELLEIIPAIELAKKQNLDVYGPEAPDIIFSKALGGQYDIVVAMYHDQGHIPLKVLGFRLGSNTKTFKTVKGVNITLGLPIIRTSVDHGTAFDQAGKGTASEESMLNAIDYSIELCKNQ